jgi:hypothetical protein
MFTSKNAPVQQWAIDPATGDEIIVRAPTPMLQVDDTLTDEEIRGMNEETKHNNGQAQDTDHDCPIQHFLDDPITQYFGIASEFMGKIHCNICEHPEPI